MRLPRFLLPLKWFYQSHLWCFWARVRYLFLFADAVWHFDTCDYAPLMRLLHVATKEMAKLYKEHSHVVDSDKTARQLTIVAELCKRIEADDYFTNAGYNPETWKSLSDFKRQRIVKHAEYISKQDAAYLGKMMTRVQWWWQ